jgi:hypothetical protein
MSQLLARLESDLASEENNDVRAELLARIAGNLARLGQIPEAQERIDQLRRTYGRGEVPRVSLWIMFAEGLIQLYRDGCVVALDRMGRVQALAVAMQDRQMIGLASAWKAQIEFELSKFDSMIESLVLAGANAEPNDNDARVRVAIVASSAFMLCGNRERAGHWFTVGRAHALKNGDQASVEALQYNRAAMSFAWLRFEACRRPVDAEELKAVRREIDSARNLQDLTRITTLYGHIYLCDARLLILEQRYDAAIEKLMSARQHPSFASHNFDQSLIDLEIALCKVRQGELVGVDYGRPLVDVDKFSGMDQDEQVYASWVHWQLCVADRTFGDADGAFARFGELETGYRNLRLSLSRRLENNDSLAALT